VERKSELDNSLRQVLDGLRGQSNWIPSALTGSSSESNYYGVVLMGISILIIAGGGIGLWRVSGQTPKGKGLVLAILIWGAGQQISGIRVREALLLSGSVCAIGVVGVIIGLIDLFRNPKLKKKRLDRRTQAEPPETSAEVSE